MKSKFSIIGDPSHDLTLCLFGGGNIHPTEIIMPGLLPSMGYTSGDCFSIYVEGRRHPLPVDQIADDFNLNNPFQFVKVIAKGQSYRELVFQAYEEGAFLNGIEIQNYLPDTRTLPRRLYYGSTNEDNHVNEWGFHWVNVTMPQKAFDDTLVYIPINLTMTTDIIIALDVPRGSHFGITYIFNNK